PTVRERMTKRIGKRRGRIEGGMKLVACISGSAPHFVVAGRLISEPRQLLANSFRGRRREPYRRPYAHRHTWVRSDPISHRRHVHDTGVETTTPLRQSRSWISAEDGRRDVASRSIVAERCLRSCEEQI